MAALDLGSLKIGIEVDDKKAKSQLQSFTGDVESTGNTLKSKFSSIATKAGKALKVGIVAGSAAAVAGLTKISKEALDLYSTFEQLRGGVSKLFGDDAQTVMDNAQKAWQTAGITANQYMEQATSFSASLIQSLNGDTQKAAATTDMAIQDMMDNASVFGSSLESIQSAYAGFSKGQYQLLDNLKLGYGGTKTEMERLLADAEKFSGVHYDISSLDDVYNAIHVVQEEMNITGTTAKEAMETIEGSVNATKAAWQNLLTGLGDDDADIEELVNNLLTSAGAAMKNIVPRLGQIIKSVFKALGSTIKQLAGKAGTDATDEVFEKIKAFPARLLDWLINAINSLSEYLEGEGASNLASKAGEMLVKVITTLIKKAPALISSLIRLATMLFQRGVEAIAKAVLGVFTGLVESVKKAWDSIKRKVSEKAKASIDTGALGAFIEKCKQVKDWWDSVKKKLSEKATAHAEQKTTGGSIGGTYKKHRVGLREVPYDGYLAELHRGESILTSAETNQVNRFLEKMYGSKSLQDDNQQTPVNNTENITHYTFGDITLDVKQLEDLLTVDQFVSIMKQAKAFV